MLESRPLLLNYASLMVSNRCGHLRYDSELMVSVVDGNVAHEQSEIAELAATRKTAVGRETTDDE